MEKNKESYGIISPVNINPGIQGAKQATQAGLASMSPINYSAVDKFFETLQKRLGDSDKETNNIKAGIASSNPDENISAIDYAKSVPGVFTAVKGNDLPDNVPTIEAETDYPWGGDIDGKGGFNMNKAANVGLTALNEIPNLIATHQGLPKSRGEATGRVLSTGASFANIGGSVVPGIGHAIGFGAGILGGLGATAGSVKKYERKALTEANNKLRSEVEQEALDRARMYMQDQRSQNLETTRNLLAESNGYYYS